MIKYVNRKAAVLLNSGSTYLNNKDIESFVKHPIKIVITEKASGKSTVSEIIKNLGFLVFESDKE